MADGQRASDSEAVVARRHTRALWAVLCLVCVLLFGSTVHHELGDLGGDSATYILLAHSLATGQGYRDLTDPAQRPHVKYPPLFPLMLAPFVAAFGPLTFGPMHALVAACAVLAVLLSVLLVRALDDDIGAWSPHPSKAMSEKRLSAAGWVGGWLVGWATAAHPWVVAAMVCIWTEFPYLAWSLMALYALHRYRATPTTPWLWFAALATAAAALTRTIGWTLVAAGVCTLWPRDRWRWMTLLAWLGLTLVPLTLWTLRNTLLSNAADPDYRYLQQMLLLDPYDPTQGTLTLHTLGQRMWLSAVTYLAMVSRLLGGGVWPLLMSRLIAIVAAVGWIVEWKHRRGVMEWYLLWYGLFLLPHPWREERFLLPLIPLLWHYLWRGGRWCVRQLTRPLWARLLRLCFLTTLGITLTVQGVATAQLVALQHRDDRVPPPEVVAHDPTRHSVQWATMYERPFVRQAPSMVEAMSDYLGLLDWMRHHLVDRTLILGRKPPIITLLAGQPSRCYPFTTDAAPWRALVSQPLPVALVLDDYHQASLLYAKPFVSTHQHCFVAVHTVGRATLFRVQQDCWDTTE